MIPEHRMAALLAELKDYQIQHCTYHSSTHRPSLYTNHICGRMDFPLETLCELDRHRNEVWFLAFSNDGTKLATASADKTVVIYDTTSFIVTQKLMEHTEPVVYVSWSPDDRQLVTCSKDQSAKVWDTEVSLPCREHE